MQFNKTWLAAALVATGSLTAFSTVSAETESDSFDVKLTVEKTCTIDTSAAEVDFANVAAGNGSALSQLQTTLTVNCSKNTPYVIALTPGNSNTDGTGEMTGPDGASTDTVAYKLTQDAAGNDAWGNDDGTNTVGGTASNFGTDIINSIYASVTDDADVEPGAYIDTVAVDVTY